MRFVYVVGKLKAMNSLDTLNVPTQRVRTFFSLLTRCAIESHLRLIAFVLGESLRRNKSQSRNQKKCRANCFQAIHKNLV